MNYFRVTNKLAITMYYLMLPKMLIFIKYEASLKYHFEHQFPCHHKVNVYYVK